MTSTAIHRPSSAGRYGIAEPLWPLYAVLFSSVAIVTGLVWDISWHRSIGRDSFWAPPHVLEQLAAVVAGVSCGFMVLRTTLGTMREKRRAVKFWGFYGPLGMWVCIWGTLMMIVSAPFDNWWHNAYGLDVRIISPPHMVLAWGMIAIQVGAMLTIVARQNRGQDDSPQLGFLYLGAAAMLLTMHATVLMEEAAFPHQMHGARFYQITSLFFPLALVALTIPSRLRWPAATAAAIYMAVDILLMWILQLSPAEPMLAPIFNPVTRMVPHPFPLLLVIPAAAIDLMLRRARGGEDGDAWSHGIGAWRLSAMIGAAFVSLMAIVHWLFAMFLLSPAARNIVFGADKWDYDIPPGAWRYEYWQLDTGRNGEWSPLLFLGGLLVAVLIATLSSRVGLFVGRGLARIQR